ncbi:hypothetical protein OVN20_11335 [Microcella daejeonensis]|uniref:hypothetical protein n=1 Tax=Microcella daejeonensis TaxID=2994971 RepID=UPI002271C108|nr:hypothetical protein [Microcella daejeonensis]WAB83632.1 hypothetical protein OVN20_11335 [Microcella daejeonensis]
MTAVIALLAGCSALPSAPPQSVALDTEPGWPADAPIRDPLLSPDASSGDPVGWIDEQGRLVIVTFGSSSCPPIATSIGEVDGGVVPIRFEPTPAQACTDDLAPLAHVFASPEGLDRATVTVTVVDGGGRERVFRDVLAASAGPDGSSIAESTAPGLPEGSDPVEPPLDVPVVLQWSAEPDRVLVTTYGSSSCPLLPIALEADASTFVLTVSTGRVEACTADYGPTTSVVMVPAAAYRALDEGTVLVLSSATDSPPQQLDVPIAPPGAAAR